MDPRMNDQTLAQRAAEAARQSEDYVRRHDANEMGDDAKAQAEAVAADLRRKAETAGAASAEKIDQAMTQTGDQMSSLAQTVRERRPDGQLGDVANATADALERGGRYLKEHDLDDVRTDFERIVRRYPIQSLLVSAGVSFLIARGLRR